MIGFSNNKAIGSIMSGNKSIVLCKLDIEKACNHVNWCLPCLVLDKMGFREK